MEQSQQIVFEGRLHSVADRQRKHFQTERLLSRFWAKDVSIWPSDEPQLTLIRNNLKWVDLPDTLEPLLLENSRAAEISVQDGLVE